MRFEVKPKCSNNEVEVENVAGPEPETADASSTRDPWAPLSAPAGSAKLRPAEKCPGGGTPQAPAPGGCPGPEPENNTGRDRSERDAKACLNPGPTEDCALGGGNPQAPAPGADEGPEPEAGEMQLSLPASLAVTEPRPKPGAGARRWRNGNTACPTGRAGIAPRRALAACPNLSESGTRTAAGTTPRLPVDPRSLDRTEGWGAGGPGAQPKR